jgi:hypothetical protein
MRGPGFARSLSGCSAGEKASHCSVATSSRSTAALYDDVRVTLLPVRGGAPGQGCLIGVLGCGLPRQVDLARQQRVAGPRSCGRDGELDHGQVANSSTVRSSIVPRARTGIRTDSGLRSAGRRTGEGGLPRPVTVSDAFRLGCFGSLVVAVIAATVMLC